MIWCYQRICLKIWPMKKLLTKLPLTFLVLIAITLPTMVFSAGDQPDEVPPPPDINTVEPPPPPQTTDKSADNSLQPPPAPAAPAVETPATKSSNSDVVPPPPPAVEAPASKTSEKEASPVQPPPAPAVEAPAPATAEPQVKKPEATKTSKTTSKKESKKAAKKTTKKTETKNPAPAIAVQPSAENVQSIPVAPAEPSGPSLSQLVTAYKYAYELYSAQQFSKAKDIFKKVALLTTHPVLKSNSLYYYSQCSFRTEDYLNCVKALKVLVKKEPDCAAIKKGYVSRFCVFLIDQAAHLQTNWDYFRYQIQTDENGKPVWRESIPPGPKLKRINFRLGFGLYNVLHAIQPGSTEDVAAKQKLETMLNTPITVLWVDEKAAKTRYGHPSDFFSVFSTNEKKDFSKVICERMFFDFQTEYFYKFLDMHDDVRNLKPRFVATSKVINLGAVQAPLPAVPAGAVTTALSTEEEPDKVLNLGNLLHFAGYFPWLDSYTNTIETAPTDLNL